MATRTITTKLAIEGESEYRQAVANINNSLKTLKSELALVESEYRDNANSMKALEAKSETLAKLQVAHAEKLKETGAALENAEKAQRQYGYAVEQSGKKLAGAKAKLEELKNATSGTSVQQEKLTAEVKKHEAALEQSQRYQAAAQRGVEDWQRIVNYAGRELNNLNGKLKDNDGYLKEAKAATDKCATSIDEYGKKTNKAAKEAKNANDTMNAMAAALAAAGITVGLRKVVDTIRACVNASVEFESAMAGVYKTVDGTPEQLAAISDGIKQLSTEIPATTTEIAAVAEAAGQLGIATGDVLAFSKVMLDLGESTNLSADQAATALARFANITGTSANNYERLGSVIVGLGNHFATTEAEITDMATRLASAGTLAGLTETEIMALATAMSSVGIEADAGGTAMTQTLTEMEKAVVTGGEKLTEFAGISGMSANEFSAAWENAPITAIQAFISGLGDLDAQGESATLALDKLGLSGVRQSNMLKSLALASDTMTGAVDLANQAWAENTALSDEANKRYETTESKLAMMENAFGNVKTAMGDALAPALREMAEVGTDAFSWAAAFIEDNPWLVQAITGAVGAVALLAGGLASYAVIAKTVAAVQTALNLTFSLRPVVAVAAAIGALIAVISNFAASAKDASAANRDLVDSLEESRAAYADTKAALTEQADGALTTASAIEELAAKEHKTMAEKETLLGLTKQLNEEVPGLNLAYNELDDTLNMTAEDIQKVVQAMAEQEEREAGIQRMVELERERIQIENDLAAAQDTLTKATEAKNQALADGVYSDIGSIEKATELDAAVKSAAKSVDELTAQETLNTEESSAATAAYGALTHETEALGGETEAATQALADLTETSTELSGKTTALTDEVNRLSSALQEQQENGSLNLDTTLKLIDAGYGAAISVNQETGAVTLNKASYIELAQAKMEEQIAALQSQKSSVDSAAQLQQEAYWAQLPFN